MTPGGEVELHLPASPRGPFSTASGRQNDRAATELGVDFGHRFRDRHDRSFLPAAGDGETAAPGRPRYSTTPRGDAARGTYDDGGALEARRDQPRGLAARRVTEPPRARTPQLREQRAGNELAPQAHDALGRLRRAAAGQPK